MALLGLVVIVFLAVARLVFPQIPMLPVEPEELMAAVPVVLGLVLVGTRPVVLVRLE